MTPVFAYEFEGRAPKVHPEAFVAPTATLIGDVTVEKGASIWYGAVLRAADWAGAPLAAGCTSTSNSTPWLPSVETMINRGMAEALSPAAGACHAKSKPGHWKPSASAGGNTLSMPLVLARPACTPST